MKKLNVLFIFASIALFTFSCKKDTETGLYEGQMTSTIDGVNYNYVCTATNIGTDSVNTLTVAGTSLKNGIIIEFINFTPTKKAYSIGALNLTQLVQAQFKDYIGASTEIYYAKGTIDGTSGTITVTGVSETSIQGKFDFTAKTLDGTKSKKVTGSFNASI
jgi:hypothetical protein